MIDRVQNPTKPTVPTVQNPNTLSEVILGIYGHKFFKYIKQCRLVKNICTDILLLFRFQTLSEIGTVWEWDTMSCMKSKLVRISDIHCTFLVTHYYKVRCLDTIIICNRIKKQLRYEKCALQRIK